MNNSKKWFWICATPLAFNIAEGMIDPEVSTEFLQPDTVEVPYYALFSPEECKNNPVSLGVLGVTTATAEYFG